MIKAIETNYKGYAFRSRLEARWAVYFDALGIKWRYEDQGYERKVIDTHDIVAGAPWEEGAPYKYKVVRYLPDFYLPDANIFVEVKGDRDALVADWEKQVDLHDWGGVLPGFEDSYGTHRGLVFLNDIPDPAHTGCFAAHVLQHCKGLVKTSAILTPSSYRPFTLVGDSCLRDLCCITPDITNLECGSPKDWSMYIVAVDTPQYYPAVQNALRAARSARFEHGHSGAVAVC